MLPDEEAEAVKTRKTLWRNQYQLKTVEDEWLFEQVVIQSVRIDLCRRLESELRIYQAHRAGLFWESDRRLAAEDLAQGLARQPARIRQRLAQTRQGCDWLIDRWRSLSSLYDRTGDWTDAQRSLALDLLGIPAELRDDHLVADPLALVAREIEGLEILRAGSLDDLDAYESSAAELGIELTPCRALARLRRYEVSCTKTLQWARSQLLPSSTRAEPSAASCLHPAPLPNPVPAPTPTSSPIPPRPDFDPGMYDDPSIPVLTPHQEKLYRQIIEGRATPSADKPKPPPPRSTPSLPAAYSSVPFTIGQSRPVQVR